MSDADNAQSAEMPQKVEGEYGVDQMRYMSDLEHVRERAGMYIGNKNVRGMHHLVQEVVDNSIDEVMAGHATKVTVVIHANGSLSVTDDGRGIPVAYDPNIGKPALEGVMTMLKYGGKFNKQAYKTSGGLHGIGVKAVNFLSEWCEVEVRRDGHVWQQEYERGKPLGPVTKLGMTTGKGTKTNFKPDPQAFGDLKFDYNILHRRLQELAFLNPGALIELKDERTSESDSFCYRRGIIEFVEFLNRATDPIHKDVIYVKGDHPIEGREDTAGVEIALQYCTEFTENVQCFVNNLHTIDGGTHLTGFRTALTRTLSNYGKKENVFKDLVPTGEDFRDGLTAIISLRHPDPQFESQTKVKLNNTEVESIVSGAVGEFLGKYLEENPKTARILLQKALTAAEAREAAKKARELVQRKKGVMSGGSLPGKLRDCTSKDIDRCELYLVEGDSAGGSAEGGRLREYQAILPLRGKIINAYKSREDKVLANEEIQSMIHAIGIGFGMDQDLSKRRYSKIIIMTDADVDGSHIRTLLLTFFYRQMGQLIVAGHVFVAQPPLFRVRRGKKETYYVQTEEEMRTQLLEKGMEDCVLEGGGKVLAEGERFTRLCRTLASLEEALTALERRGISLKEHALRQDADTKRLPVYHVLLGTGEHWFATRAALDEFLRHQETTGREAHVVDAPTSPEAVGAEDAGEPATRLHVIELHEVRTINRGLADLGGLGFDVHALIPQVRTGVQEARYKLRRDEVETGLEDLRGLLAAVRAAGEVGLQVTRFKGLGEMNAEELRETTLDPAHRTLIQVSMRDVGAADEMFRVLMGDKVEPRREFIEKHALEVRNLDV